MIRKGVNNYASQAIKTQSQAISNESNATLANSNTTIEKEDVLKLVDDVISKVSLELVKIAETKNVALQSMLQDGENCDVQKINEAFNESEKKDISHKKRIAMCISLKLTQELKREILSNGVDV
jgi:hypothetical protein